MMRGLLDLTDKLSGGRAVPPPDVVRHDDDDPYLVVAADKGTASFSVFANGVFEEYGFLIGEAFASGRRVVHDHNKMGITFRGVREIGQAHIRTTVNNAHLVCRPSLDKKKQMTPLHNHQ